MIVSSVRIRAELGYAEPVATHEALRRAVAWARANPPPAAEPLDYRLEDGVLAAVVHQ